MTITGVQTGVPQWATGASCTNKYGCVDNTCPDFIIKRHDTKPPFRVAIEDCSGSPSEDLTGENIIAEVSMWSQARLKSDITSLDTYFALASNVGFDQMLVGDVIILDRVRRPEQMLVVGFDETNKLVEVERGYNETEASAWDKGTAMKIFRVKDSPAIIERTYDDVINVDGTTSNDQLVGTYLSYDWQPNDTCVPGCYMLEFKLLQLVTPPSSISVITTDEDSDGTPEIIDITWSRSLLASIIPSFATSTDFGCDSGLGVEWVRRYPQTRSGFTVQVIDSPTAE